MGSSDLNPDELTPEERGAREERLFQLSEALQASIEAGNTHENSVWAVRFHLSEPEVERVRRGLELLFFDDEEVEAPEYAAAAIPLTPPELPDDYELRGELGRGGMGIVYRVRQVSLDRELALKVLRPGELQAQRAIDRFKREARSLARLRHPHIASLHEVGECAGRVYFTMDLIEGHSLATVLKEGAVTPSRASRWARQLASALQYVHSHGLVHRDIKPANILIDEEDNACLVDFGLAREVEVSSDLTMSGHFLGTPAYMAPEQVRGQNEAVGETADIYALGVVLYECLTGKRAFGGKTLVEVIHAVAEGTVTAPSDLDGKIPTSLELICLQAMNREAPERYATARALLEDLERFEAGRLVLARPPSNLHRARDFWQRNLPSMRVAVVTAVVMVVVFGLLVMGPLGGLRFERDLLQEAQSLVESGQPELAVGLFDRYYPENPEGPALTSIGLSYCDALLELCDDANWDGDEERLEGLSIRVKILAEQASRRLGQERQYGNPELFALNTEWAYRELEATAFQKNEGRAKLTESLWQHKSAMHQGAVDQPKLDGKAWGQSPAANFLVARAFIPDLLDPGRAHHEQAVVFWLKALDGGSRAPLSDQEALALLAEKREVLPRVLIALLKGSPELLTEKRNAFLALQSRDAARWTDAVGLCNPRDLREALMKALRGHRGFPSESNRLKRFCRAVLELPNIDPGLDDTAHLLELLEPAEYLARNDLDRRVEYLAELVVSEPGMDVDPIISWVKDVTGKRVNRTSLLRQDRGADREAFAMGLRTHFERYLDAFDSRHEIDTQQHLAAFDEQERNADRRMWHERLKFELPAGLLPPVFPRYEPAALANSWHSLLDPASMCEPLRVKLAALRFDFGASKPKLRESLQFDSVPGTPWRVELDIPTPEIAHKPGDGLPGVMGFESSAGLGRIVLTGEVNWGPGGLSVQWSRPVSVAGSFARVGGPYGARATMLHGETTVAAHITFPRERNGTSVAEDYIVLQLLDRDVGDENHEAGALWEATGQHRTGAVAEWLAAGSAAERQPLAKLDEFQKLDDDVELGAWRIAIEQGATLAPAEERRLANLEQASDKRRMKGFVLWGVTFVFAFVLVGGMVLGVRHAFTKKERAKRSVLIGAATQDEIAAMAPSLLTTTIILAWWPGNVEFGWFWFRMALYSLLSWNACRHVRSKWKWVPSIASALAAVSFLLIDWWNADVVRDQGDYVLPFLLFFLGLFALPVVFDEYWSWHPDPVKGARLRKTANNIFLVGFIVPILALLVIDDDLAGLALLGGGLRGAFGVLFPFIMFLGLEIWLICLLRATNKRSREIAKHAVNRRKAALREQKATAS